MKQRKQVMRMSQEKAKRSTPILLSIPESTVNRLMELVQPSQGTAHPLAKRVYERTQELHLIEIEMHETIQTLVNEYIARVKRDFDYLMRLRQEVNPDELMNEYDRLEKDKKFAHKGLIFASGGKLPQIGSKKNKKNENALKIGLNVAGPAALLSMTLIPAVTDLMPHNGNPSWGTGTLLSFLVGSAITYIVFTNEDTEILKPRWYNFIPVPGLLILAGILGVRLISATGLQDFIFALAMTAVETAALMLVSKSAKKHRRLSRKEEEKVHVQQVESSKAEKWQAQYDELSTQSAKLEKLLHLLSIEPPDFDSLEDQLRIIATDAVGEAVASNISKLFNPETGENHAK